MIAAVIFDLFGTLLDISHDSRPFDKLARLSDNYRQSIETALTSDQPTLYDFAAHIDVDANTEIERLQAALDADIQRVLPFDDAIPTLATLRKHQIKTAVISNLASPYKQPFFNLAIDGYVDAVVFSCDCGYIKPNRQIYELALRELGCAPAECVMVGDSFRSDVDGPSRVGIMGIHIVRDEKSSRAQCAVTSLQSVLAKCNITKG